MPQEVVRLQISVAGDDKAISALQSLDQLADRLNKTPIKLNIDTSNLAAMEKQVSASLNQITKNINAQARLLEAKNQEANINAKLEQSANQRATAEAKVAAEAEKTRQAIEKTAQAQAKVQEAQAKVSAEEAKVAQQAEKTRQAIEKTAQAQAKVEGIEQRRQLLAEQMSAAQEKTVTQARAYSDAVEKTANTPLQDQIDALTGVSREYKSAADSAKVFEEAASRARLEIEKKVGFDTGNIFDLSKGTNGMRDYIKNVEGIQNATVAATRTVEAGGRTFQQFSVSARNASGDIGNMTISVDTATGSVHKLDQGMSSTNKTAGMLKQSLGDIVLEFGKWYIIGNIFSVITGSISEAVQELKNVDSELVNIQKVMGATAGEMEQLSDKAYEVGSALGVAASDYLASVNKWAQAGYGSLSDELGELSVRTQKVGDVQEETANQFLLSVDAAYQYKGNIEALTRVLDGANEISNNYATSVEKLAGGMGIVSSLAAQAGMEVQETMAAIGTITAVTQESGNSAARALRALILNIQGETEIAIDDASGERWTEDEIEATAAALGDLNIATREYKDGVEQLRNPMEVIGELSEKYRQGLINEVQLQEVVSSLGGKVRSNQLQALITNYDMYEEMLQTYSESVGSADKELDIYLNSWEAKSERLKNSWVELVAAFEVENIAKGLLDVANALLQIANTPAGRISIVATAMVALNSALSALAKTQAGIKAIETFKKIDNSITGLMNTFASQGLQAGAAKFGTSVISAFKGIGSAITSALGPVGIAITAFYALVTVSDYFSKAAERAAEKVSDLSSEYESGVSALEGYESQLEEIRDRIAEINGQDTLSFTDKEELKELEAQSGELERQIALQQILNREKQKELEIASKNALNTGYAMEDAPNVWNFLVAAFNSGPFGRNPAFEGISDPDALNEWFEKFQIATAGGFEEQAEKIAKMLDNLNQKKEDFLSEHGDDPNDWTKEQIEKYNEMEKDIAEMNITAVDFYNQLQDNIDGLTDGAEKEYWQGVADAFYQAIIASQSLSDRIDLLTTSMDDATKTDFLDMLSSIQADGIVTEQEIQKLIDKFPVLNQALGDGEYTLADLAAFFSEAANSAENFGDEMNETATEAELMKKAADDLSETLSKLESALSTLESAQEELKENGELSIGTVDSLIQQFPELTDLLYEYLAGLVTEQELQQALSDQYNKSANDYKRSIVEKMMSNEEFYKNTVLTNTNIVSKLAELGITDLENYKTLEELKEEVNRRIQEQMTQNAQEGEADREKVYTREAKAFAKLQGAMLASQKLVIDKMLPTKPKSLTDIVNQQNGVDPNNTQYYDFGTGRQPDGSISQSTIDSYWDDVMDILSSAIDIPELSFDSDSGSSGSGSSSTKSWYEEQIENLQNLISETQDTNTLLEKEEADSYGKRIANLQAMQNRVHDMANQFRARGLADTSEEVKQLKLMYHDLADEIEAVYKSMYDDLMEEHADRQWNLDLFEKGREQADRSVEEIAADCEKIVAQYKSMQQDVADLANYYRSQGYDETDDLIQDLSDAWWEYQEQIESVYDALTDAFSDYISESDRQIRALERTTGTAGQQIEIYTQRIKEAQKAIQALQAANVNGATDDRIGSVQDQIYSDEDAVSNLQDELWSELEAAVDKEFDKWQDKIDEAQEKLDEFNEAVEKLDEELQEKIEPLQEQIEEWQEALEDALEPIEEKLEDLNDRLEAEQEALEALTDPLEKQIEGYYTVNPDGTVGEYIPGINDKLDDLNEQLDEENRKWDEQKEREEAALALQKKELALQEAIKKLEQAQLDLETARNERTVYTLKDGVWAWRPDEKAIQEAEDAVEDAEQAKEDAEKELQDLKEEQAHNQIIKLLEDQIEALEKQKDQIEAQIEIYEKESQARRDYLQDQIDFWEKEKEVKEDYYNGLIEANEKEIEAWEEYYEKRKEAYDDDIEFWENEVKNLQEKYDAWAERWEDIQDAMTDDVRSIEEILSDIARYGTPEMKAQIDNITDLLRDMGVALGDFNSSIDSPGSGGNTGGGSYQDIIDQMRENALAWQDAMERGDQDKADYYYDQNQMLGNSIGATFNPGSGKWYDSNGNLLFDIPSYSGGGSSGSGSSRPSGGGSSSGGSNYESVAKKYADDIARMEANSQYYRDALDRGDQATADMYYQWNQRIGAGIPGASFHAGTGEWTWPDGTPLFDRGGVAHGKGIMVKDVSAPEVVLSPVLAADVLNPVSNEQFDRFAKDLGIMFGAAQNYAPDTRMAPGGTTSNDNRNYSHQTYINGVELGENMLDRPLSEILSLLGLHRNY